MQPQSTVGNPLLIQESSPNPESLAFMIAPTKVKLEHQDNKTISSLIKDLSLII